MGTPKNVLLMLERQSTSLSLEQVFTFAREHDWRLFIHDPYQPPIGWTGDGVITSFPSDGFIQACCSLHIPVVSVIPCRPRPGLSFAVLDYARFGQLAARHLRSSGFSRVAWFSLEWSPMHKLVLDGFRHDWPDVQLTRLVWPKAAKPHERNDFRLSENWAKTEFLKIKRPFAVLAYNTYNAVHALDGCQAAHLSVPDDVAILATLDDNKFLVDTRPITLSGIGVPHEALSCAATHVLERLMHGQDVATVKVPELNLRVRQSTDITATDDPFLNRVFSCIRARLGTPFGPAQIAGDLGIARSTLDLNVSTRLGHSLGTEILHQRLRVARRLLADPKRKLEAIAAETGFCHAAYFIRSFRKVFGITPHKWRQIQSQSDPAVPVTNFMATVFPNP